MSIDVPLTGAQFARDMFDHYVGKYNKAAAAVRNSARRLPDFFDPESHTTDCVHAELYIAEPGISRYERVDDWAGREPAVVDAILHTLTITPENWMHAHTRGHDAYSETGLVEYLECLDCNLRWRMPENVTWD